MKIRNLLDKMTFPQDVHPLVEYAHRAYWEMLLYCPIAMDRWGFEKKKVPNVIIFEITDDIAEYGLYYDHLSYIAIRDRPTAPKKMQETVLHELAHLVLTEILGHAKDHDLIFWEFLRRFKRFAGDRI